VISTGGDAEVGSEAASDVFNILESAEQIFVMFFEDHLSEHFVKVSVLVEKLLSVKPSRPVTAVMLQRQNSDPEEIDKVAEAVGQLSQLGTSNTVLLQGPHLGYHKMLAVAGSVARAVHTRRTAYRRQIIQRDEQCCQLFWQHAHEIIPDFPQMQLPQEVQWSSVDVYNFEHLIGQGSFGRVYLSQEPDTGVKKAVKVYQKCRINDVETIMSIISEKMILEKLNHPHIVKAYCLLHARYNVYMFMEMCGTNLLKVIKSEGGKVDLHPAEVVYVQIANAVAYMQQHLVAHRDIKPENIVVASTGTAKLIDFGMAVEVNRGFNPNGGRFGTVPFMSPEYMTGRCKDPLASDIFSLGVVIIEMVLGHGKLCTMLGWGRNTVPCSETAREFKNFLTRQNLVQHIFGKWCSNAPLVLVNFVERMLKVGPLERPSAAEVAALRWSEGVLHKGDLNTRLASGNWTFSPHISWKGTSTTVSPDAPTPEEKALPPVSSRRDTNR